jgi:alpha-galactosidase
VHEYYGPAISDPIPYPQIDIHGQTGLLTLESREFPDSGRGDFRQPAIHLRTKDGCTVSEFSYISHEIIEGKHPGEGLPTTHGKAGDVTSLKVYLKDEVNDIEVTLNYAVFHKLDAITRSFELVNKGKEEIVIERAESFSVDLPRAESDWEMVGLHGDWAREGRKFRRKIDWGTQGYVLLHI